MACGTINKIYRTPVISNSFYSISHVIVEHEMKHRSASTPKKSASPFASSSQHTTPQRLGVQVGTMSEEDDILKDNFLDGPALDRRGNLNFILISVIHILILKLRLSSDV